MTGLVLTCFIGSIIGCTVLSFRVIYIWSFLTLLITLPNFPVVSRLLLCLLTLIIATFTEQKCLNYTELILFIISVLVIFEVEIKYLDPKQLVQGKNVFWCTVPYGKSTVAREACGRQAWCPELDTERSKLIHTEETERQRAANRRGHKISKSNPVTNFLQIDSTS